MSKIKSNMQMPRMGLIIVTHNAEKYLPDFLKSLEKTNYPKERLQIIVVDNASTDGTIEYLKDNPFFRINPLNPHKSAFFLIENQKNTGFAKGNNIGAEAAQKFNPKYLVLLNQDTVVEPDWLEQLVEAAEKDGKIGIVQSKLLLWNPLEGPSLKGRSLINSLGNEIHFLGFGFCKGYREQSEGGCDEERLRAPLVGEFNKIKELRRGEAGESRGVQSSNNNKLVLRDGSSRSLPSEITYASGAAMLVRNELYKKIGLFDKDFFMYHEDLDLGWRARLAGYKIVLAPKSIIYHKYEFSKSIQKYYFMERNRFIVLVKNYKLASLLLIAPFLFIMEIGLFFQSIFTGWWTPTPKNLVWGWKEKIRVYKYFLSFKNWQSILQKRKQIQSLRIKKDKDVIKYFTGKIEYQEISSPLLRYIANPFFGFSWAILRRIIYW